MKKYRWIIIIAVMIIGVGAFFYWMLNKPYRDNNAKNLKEEMDIKTKAPHVEEDKKILSTYDNPFVPVGFITVDTENAKWAKNDGIITDWNKGLVIEDDNGNHYVWVPVDQKTVKKDGYYTPNHGENGLILLERRENNQIDQCGGFYVGRYECGVPQEIANVMSGIDENTNMIEGKPVSKQGAKPWNFITFPYAKENSKKMIQQEDAESVLIPESYWLILMEWLRHSDFDIDNTSVNFGNYSNAYFSFSGLYSEDEGNSFFQENNVSKGSVNSLLTTGISERNKANNIYDIAGNVNEFVDGKVNNCFGGNYSNLGQGASDGAVYGIRDSNSFTGFRVVLLNVSE